jgi:hypothetical protein
MSEVRVVCSALPGRPPVSAPKVEWGGKEARIVATPGDNGVVLAGSVVGACLV